MEVQADLLAAWEVKISAMTPILSLPVGAYASGSVVKWPVGIRLMSSCGSRMAVVGPTFIGSLSGNRGAQSLLVKANDKSLVVSDPLCSVAECQEN